MKRTRKPLTPRELASKGPLALKDPNSVAAAYQMTHRLKTLYQLKEASIEDWGKAVEDAERYRIYERVPPGFPSLDALLQVELGVTQEEAREHVLRRRGRPTKEEQEDHNKGCNTTIKRGTADHWIARLKRDGRLDLLARIEAGDLSPNAAAIEAGYRKVPSQLDKLNQVWDAATDDERKAFLPKVLAWQEQSHPMVPAEPAAPVVASPAAAPSVRVRTIGPSTPPPAPTLAQKYKAVLGSADEIRDRLAALRDRIPRIDPECIYCDFHFTFDPQPVEIMKTTPKQYKVRYQGNEYTINRTTLDTQGSVSSSTGRDFAFGWHLVKELEAKIEREEKSAAGVAELAEIFRLQLAQEVAA